MKKDKLAQAVARERRPAVSRAAARACRAQFVKVASATLATLRRPRWLERITLPLAALALAGVAGAAMPLLIAGEPAEGVAAPDMAAPIPASLAWSDMGGLDHQRAKAGGPPRGRSKDPPQKPTPLADGGTGPTDMVSVAVAAGETGSNAVDQPVKAQVRSEPSTSPEPDATPGVEPDVKQPTPEPTTGPTPSPPADEETGEEKQSGGKVTLCHSKGGSSKLKTLAVKEDAVAEHLAHGDTLGVCP